jgi:AcrR family transcriptional regulator
MPRSRNPDQTRQRIVAATGQEYYHHGYRAGSLNRIVAQAGVTKGALFHHFAGKEALLAAWFEELVAPAIRRQWIEPLADTTEPVDTLKRLITTHLAAAEREGHDGLLRHGCPVANLAADAAAVDEPVRMRLDGLYREWRMAIAAALTRGKFAGTVHPNVVPDDEAAFLVAALAGLATTGKASRDASLWRAACRGAEAYLETLRKPPNSA